jgi:hypothetical protein
MLNFRDSLEVIPHTKNEKGIYVYIHTTLPGWSCLRHILPWAKSSPRHFQSPIKKILTYKLVEIIYSADMDVAIGIS